MLKNIFCNACGQLAMVVVVKDENTLTPSMLCSVCMGKALKGREPEKRFITPKPKEKTWELV